MYGGLHTYSFVYVVDPFACRLRRPFLSRCLEVVGTAERSTCEWHLGPTVLFQPFLIIQACTRSVIHRGSYNWYQSHPALQGLSQMVVVSLANILVAMYTREKQNARVGLLPLFFLPPTHPFLVSKCNVFNPLLKSSN